LQKVTIQQAVAKLRALFAIKYALIAHMVLLIAGTFICSNGFTEAAGATKMAVVLLLHLSLCLLKAHGNPPGWWFEVIPCSQGQGSESSMLLDKKEVVAGSKASF
jgi:hypothetical protein